VPPPDVVESVDTSRSSFDNAARPRPVRIYLWEPLVRPLAQAGFLVAAVDHHGNNWVDGYAAPGFVFVWERPADLRHALNLIERHRTVDWVGAAGFSAGGYTAAALVGVRLDPDLVRLLTEGMSSPGFGGEFVSWYSGVR
jgi:hypothetical protein